MEKVSVIYEDNHLLVVNKPSGLLVQGDQTGDKTLSDWAKAYIKEKYDKPGAVFLGVVHRLDRPVSGVVVLARTSKGLERMNELFRKREIQKYYWAIVKKHPPKKSDKLVHWIEKNSEKNKVTVYEKTQENAQRAELRYRVLGKLNEHFLLEVAPITGRPHQIRGQLSQIGSPIRGDIKYGYPKANEDRSIHLHARKLYFTHPVKKEPLILTAGVPNTDFWEQFLVLDKPNPKDKDLGFLH